MSKRVLLIGVTLIVLLAILGASQTRRGQNLYYAINYERVYDRYSQTDTTEAATQQRIDQDGREAKLLSAFFGLDGGLPGFLADRVICEGAGGADGMPVIFSHEVDPETLDPGDFKVTLSSGAIGTVTCLTLAPADGPGELRTVLLAGEFGSVGDEAASVEIVGDILSRDGDVTFKGARVDVTPLEEGPSLVLAEIVPQKDWNLGQSSTPIPFGGGSGCPLETKQVVRVTWAGGITKPSGAAADEVEGALYRLTVRSQDSSTRDIAPMALADTGDGDNNHALCLDAAYSISEVSFPAGHVTDPRDDLNPATRITLTP